MSCSPHTVFVFKRWSRRHWPVISAGVMHLYACFIRITLSENLFSIWIGSFESRHFTLYRYILMSVRQRYTRSFALKFTDIKMAETASCLLSFHKSAFCCYCECAYINRVFTDLKDILPLSVWPKMTEYFKSKRAHRRLHLSCSDRYCSASTLHRRLNSAHFSRITWDWASM